jgi:riboflavin kinase/FMN adenylyltransferase
VTIGVFDGVHRGHQVTIGRAVERARELGLPTVVLTFDPHPSEVVRPGSHPAMLTSPRYKAELLEQLGVDVELVLPFTLALSQMSPAEFVHTVLVEELRAAVVIVGENFHYGHKQAGSVGTLLESGRTFGFSVESVPVSASEDRTTWSSTYVRSCVLSGDVEGATRALGREHRLEGTVVRGDARGREIGFPTANLDPLPWSAVPSDGIYAGHLVRGAVVGSGAGSTAGSAAGSAAGSVALPAAISIGTNPTFDGDERRVEAYVLDFSGDLYGERIGLTFTARLRDTLRFDGVESLVEQMHKDVERTRELTGA